MKTRYLLSGGAFLVLGSIVCIALSVSTQAQGIRATADSMRLVRGSKSACPNAFEREPVLVYDKTGGTLAGGVHYQLSVYRDGFATYSRIDPQEPDGRVSVRTLSPAALDALVDSLAAVGAEVLCDDPTEITDVPLATVTVLQGDGADAKAHSFSYYDASAGAPALVESIVQDFIAAEIEGS